MGDKKVLEAVYNPDKIPTKINTIKPLIDRVEVTRGKICGLIKETNGEEACKSPLLSNKQNKNVIYVHTLCKTECTPYYKGTVIEIKKEECTYPEIKDPIFEIIIKFPDDYKSVCAMIEKELLIVDKKQLCAIDLFADKKTRCETPKCLLCPDICKDKKVLEAVYNPDKIPTKINTIKPLIDRVEVTRGKICGLIKETNGEEACKSPLLSNKQNKNVIYVHTLCKTECTPYYKGTVIEIKKEECTYPEIKEPPIPGPVVDPDPIPGPPDPIVDIIINFPTEYLKVCSTIKTGETILWDKKVLCAFELFEKRYETPKCLLCPEVCNDKKVAFSTKVADKTPTNMNKMKSWKNRVTVARKEICKAISATNGEAACKSSLFSNKKNKIELYVYTLCNKACSPYFKGKKKEIDQKDCTYPEVPIPVPPVDPDPIPVPPPGVPTPDPPP